MSKDHYEDLNALERMIDSDLRGWQWMVRSCHSGKSKAGPYYAEITSPDFHEGLDGSLMHGMKCYAHGLSSGIALQKAYFAALGAAGKS